jgi:hypothetical protein
MKRDPLDRIRVIAEVIVLVAALLLMGQGRAWQHQVRGQAFQVWGTALLFLCAMAWILEAVLRFSLRQRFMPRKLGRLSDVASGTGLPANDLLQMEFEYARITASEAMNDRHTVVNFYLLLTGVVVSAVAALISAERPPGILANAVPYVGMSLLWALCIVGWLYLLQIVRLRQAWRDSAKTMNRIKEFYIQRVARLSPQEYSQAFRWRLETLPPAAKLWTIHFFSAALVALLNSLVYVGGGLLCALGLSLASEVWPWVISGLGLFGVLLFVYSLHMYVLFLGRDA